MLLSRERIHQRAQHSLRREVVNSRSDASEIAERLVQSVGHCVENKPLVARAWRACNRDRQPEFERHVQSRRARSLVVKRDPGNVMKRKLRTRDQVIDAVELRTARRIVHRSRGNQSITCDARDQRKIDRLISLGVREIDESVPRCGYYFFFAARLRRSARRKLSARTSRTISLNSATRAGRIPRIEATSSGVGKSEVIKTFRLASITGKF